MNWISFFCLKINQNKMTFLIIIIALALIFDFINGFHDAANSIATIVSTRVLTPFQAVLWAALFNFAAYFIFKDHGVANTISKTVEEQYITLNVIFSGLIGAIVWNLITWLKGIPSSSSHTLIGGFAGAAIAHSMTFASVNSIIVLKITMFIFLAPIIGMIIAYLFSLWLMNSFKKSKWTKVVSVAIIVGIIIFCYLILEKDPSKLKSHYESYYMKLIFFPHNFKFILLTLIVLTMGVATLFLNGLSTMKANTLFRRLQLVSSAALSLGHGGNDAQKVMGIIMAALFAYDPSIYSVDHMVWWVPLACYTSIALGTMSGGWRIVKTMGTKITKVTPFEGVAAETAGSITLFVTEALKIPVSTTHTITGSIIGAGSIKRLSAVRWGVTRSLLIAWVITIPVSAAFAAIVYFIIGQFV